MWDKKQMAAKVIAKFHSGACVNLGIGLPTLIAECVPKEKDIFIHSENGVLGVKGRPTRTEVSPTLINAGKETITIREGASFFDSALSFGMIRGGHVDFAVLGGFEVDVKGNLANWMIPGQRIAGIGGAMDLVNGAKQVVVMMTHFNREGAAKLVQETKLPLTGVGVVDLVVTDLGIFRPLREKFVIEELAAGVMANDLKMPMKLLAEAK